MHTCDFVTGKRQNVKIFFKYFPVQWSNKTYLVSDLLVNKSLKIPDTEDRDGGLVSSGPKDPASAPAPSESTQDTLSSSHTLNFYFIQYIYISTYFATRSFTFFLTTVICLENHQAHVHVSEWLWYIFM